MNKPNVLDSKLTLSFIIIVTLFAVLNTVISIVIHKELYVKLYNYERYYESTEILLDLVPVPIIDSILVLPEGETYLNNRIKVAPEDEMYE